VKSEEKVSIQEKKSEKQRAREPSSILGGLASPKEEVGRADLSSSVMHRSAWNEGWSRRCVYLRDFEVEGVG